MAARFALLGAAFLSTLALLAGAVRVLPLVVDPELPIGVAFPFAKAVAWLGLEVALATGWVVGWALAFARFVDRGEARVHALLGRSPGDVARGLVPQAAILACAVVAASYLAARDAEAPGRVVAELVSSDAIVGLAAEGAATTIPVPFLERMALRAGETPRLLLHPPQIGTALVTASDATISGDLREARLVDARIRTSRAEVSVRELLISACRHSSPRPASAMGSRDRRRGVVDRRGVRRRPRRALTTHQSGAAAWRWAAPHRRRRSRPPRRRPGRVLLFLLRRPSPRGGARHRSAVCKLATKVGDHDEVGEGDGKYRPGELVIIALIALLLFEPAALPTSARGSAGIKNFKKGSRRGGRQEVR
ncbi:MAG: twin-arginine translocase TatA/TatE family subunit [Polyangiaceae bacterium]